MTKWTRSARGGCVVRADHPTGRPRRLSADRRDSIDLLRDLTIHHPVFTAINDMESLRRFMEAHVFAVWDFNVGRQAAATRSDLRRVAWLPPQDQLGAQLINQIVLGEETDASPAG